MHAYKDIITLNRNSRGCYILDTVKGCSYAKTKHGGCYGDCYANNIASRYGFDFSNPVKRGFEKETEQIYFNGFEDTAHESEIIRQIKQAKMPFIRIGEMGDPSENWEHTLLVCKIISVVRKPIVIITKHWNVMSEKQEKEFSKLPVIFNTSVSMLDTDEQQKYRLSQYERLKKTNKSVLRVVSCKFTNKEKEKKQNDLLSQENVIDTVFRPSKENEYLTSGVITAKKIKFLGSSMLASMHDENTFMGYCKDCQDQCGLKFFKGII